MNNNQRYASIMTNKKVKGKPMSTNQLDALLKITCRYEWVLPCKVLTVVEASALIHSACKAIAEGKIPERKKPYSFERLWLGFIRKYPDIYKEIIDR